MVKMSILPKPANLSEAISRVDAMLVKIGYKKEDDGIYRHYDEQGKCSTATITVGDSNAE